VGERLCHLGSRGADPGADLAAPKVPASRAVRFLPGAFQAEVQPGGRDFSGEEPGGLLGDSQGLDA
jgi:hypothetical protein